MSTEASGRHLLIRTLYYGLLALAVLLLLYGAAVLSVILLTGFLLAYFLEPVVNTLESRGINRVMSTALLLGLLVAALAVFMRWLGPVVADQLVDLGRDFPAYREFVIGKLGEWKSTLLDRLPANVTLEFENMLRSRMDESLQGAVLSLPALASGAFYAVIVTVFAPVIAFFFLVQGDEIKRNLVSLVPNRYFEMTLMLIYRIDQQVGSYLRGTFLDCSAVGLLAFAALSALQVPNAMAIAIFAGVTNAIPYVGPIAGALPGTLVLLLSPEAAAPWWTVPAAFGAIKVIEDVFIYPLTVGRSLKLHPLAVILGILAGEHMAGFLGMLLAVPFMAIGRTVIEVLRSSLKSYRVI
jgi:predicted PurR-regulated permease PerM